MERTPSLSLAMANFSLVTSVLMLLLQLPMAHAQQAATGAEDKTKIAKVIILRGEAKSKNLDNPNPVNLKNGDWLPEGATIQTNAKSFLKLAFFNNTQVSLGPESQMAITSFEKTKPGLLNIIKGQIRTKASTDFLKGPQANLDADGKPKNTLFLKTRTAAMGVRGTDFLVIENPVANNTTLVTFEGAVAMAKVEPGNDSSVANPEALAQTLSSKEAVVVTEGQVSMAGAKQDIPTTPVLGSPAQIDVLKTNAEFKEAAPGKTTEADKNFQSPILKGVPPQALTGAVTNPDAQKGNSHPEGSIDSKTGAIAPPAGGFIDVKTGFYIPPPPGSTFDANTGVFVPPPSAGKFDAATGSYIAPAGLTLSATGEFVKTEAPASSTTTAPGGSSAAPKAEAGGAAPAKSTDEKGEAKKEGEKPAAPSVGPQAFGGGAGDKISFIPPNIVIPVTSIGYTLQVAVIGNDSKAGQQSLQSSAQSTNHSATNAATVTADTSKSSYVDPSTLLISLGYKIDDVTTKIQNTIDITSQNRFNNFVTNSQISINVKTQ
jgi:hypothetical protein